VIIFVNGEDSFKRRESLTKTKGCARVVARSSKMISKRAGKASLMFKNTLIAATFAALLAASPAVAEDDMGAGGAPADPTLVEPQDRPPPERRRRREPRRRTHGAEVVPGYGAPNRPVDFYSGAVVGEWNYGQPPQPEAPPPSPRGLHNGLWYY
jgi:hypothetical protein